MCAWITTHRVTRDPSEPPPELRTPVSGAESEDPQPPTLTGKLGMGDTGRTGFGGGGGRGCGSDVAPVEGQGVTEPGWPGSSGSVEISWRGVVPARAGLPDEDPNLHARVDSGAAPPAVRATGAVHKQSRKNQQG